MQRSGLFLGFLLLVPGAARAGVEDAVRAAGDRVDIRVTTTPLADVLDRLARATGMKVVYDGPRPSQLVSVSVEQKTPVEAVLGLLEGSGISFALQADPTGTRCDTLFVVTPGAPGQRPPVTAALNAPAPPVVEEEATVAEEEFTPPPGMVVSPPQVVEQPGEGRPGGGSLTFPPGFNTSPPNFQGGGPPPTPQGTMPPNAPARPPREAPESES
jgi:hypothetical protein